MAKARRSMISKPGTLGYVSGSMSRRAPNNPRKTKALKKVGQILMGFPEKAGQVSAETLSQVDTSADKTGQLALTVKRALPEALSREAQRTGRKIRSAVKKYR